jgi:DNA-binding MarR family transcriptional regulator
MNLNELQQDIIDHKERLGDTYYETIKTVLPFVVLQQKIYEKISKIQEEGYKLNNSEVDVLITTLVSGDETYSITPTKLHHRLLFSTGAITKVLKKLEEKNYIIRINNPHDKRSKLVQLTPQGKETAQKVFNDMMNFHTKSLSTLSQKEKESFEKTVLKLLREV